MFGVDEGGNAAFFLRAGDNVEGEGGFTAGLGAENFDDAALGEADAA